MASAQGIINAVKTALDASTTLTALDGGRHYEHTVPQRMVGTFPHLIYDLVSPEASKTFTGTDTLDGAELQVDVYSDQRAGPAAARAVGDAVRAVLDQQTFTATGWNKVEFHALDFGKLSREEDAYRIMLRFKVFAS